MQSDECALACLTRDLAAERARVADLERQLAEVTAERDHWKAYAKALQRLHDNGGAIMEPGLGREVDELREACE